MKFLEKVSSSVDNVVKYVFRFGAGVKDIVEFSYIDNGTGKDIICVSCQTMCNMGCKFCHCTDYIGKISVFSLDEHKIMQGVCYIVRDLDVKKDTLLISYMGCGEPFNLIWENTIINSMKMIRNAYLNKPYTTVRFGLATCLPKNSVDKFFKFCKQVKDNKLPVKLHLSLHYTDDETRAEWMPASLDIHSSIAACKFYKEYTGNSVEIHYTLIAGVNDRVSSIKTHSDITKLNELLWWTGFNIKFISYNVKDTLTYIPSQKEIYFKENMLISSEIYTPPGRDIGSSCGQFLFETHSRYEGL